MGVDLPTILGAWANGLLRILVKELVSLINFTTMTKISLEYNYVFNSLRCNETTLIERGWQVVDYCDKNLADSFVQKMNSIIESDSLLSFKNIDTLKFYLRDHVRQFLVDKKIKEYSAQDKKINVLFI